jgi:hypothetical protein
MVDVRRRDRAPPSSKPGHRNMDSDKTKQHDNHVQRDDGHEQDDEKAQNRPERLGERDQRQEHLCAVKQDAEERHEQDEADDVIMGAIKLGSAGTSRSAAGVARLIHAPAAAVDFPAGQSGATCGQRWQHIIGTINRWFYSSALDGTTHRPSSFVSSLKSAAMRSRRAF